jgi:hypothetical protein
VSDLLESYFEAIRSHDWDALTNFCRDCGMPATDIFKVPVASCDKTKKLAADDFAFIRRRMVEISR